MAPRHILNVLELVHPPISARDFVQGDADVPDDAKRSLLYVIAQRPRIFFDRIVPDPEPDQSSGLAVFVDMSSSVQWIRNLRVSFDNLDFSGLVDATYSRERLEIRETGSQRLVFACTPDALLYELWHGRIGGTTQILSAIRGLLSFDAHYVGIAPRRGSVRRLLAGHSQLSRVLSSEDAFDEGARLNDEIAILLFRCVDLTIAEIDEANPEDMADINDYMVHFSAEYESRHQIGIRSLTSDAEKALVHFLEPKYNAEKYVSYPKSTNGIYRWAPRSYCLALAEPLTLRTATCSFVGDQRALLSEGEGSVVEVDGERARMLLLADSRWKSVSPGSVNPHETLQVLLYNDDRYLAIRTPRPDHLPYVPDGDEEGDASTR